MLRLQFVDAASDPQLVGQDALPGVVNYYLGSDPAGWQSGIHPMLLCATRTWIQGLTWVFYGNEQQLEHIFLVEPGADPRAIRVQVQGANQLRLDQQSNLLLDSAGGTLTLRRPILYQEKDSQRQPVEGQ